MIVEGLWVPIALFTGLTIVVCVFYWFRYRTRSDMQATIRTALEKGQELTPDIIDRLGAPKRPRDKDLRVALVFLAIAVGMSIFGFMIPDDDQEVTQIFMGMASFPFFIGLAYMIMWRFTEKS
jgi:bacteriorhodopsin